MKISKLLLFGLIMAPLMSASLMGCSTDEPTTVPTKPNNPDPEPTPNPDPKPEVPDFNIPSYPDDYSAKAGWNYHNEWNLANVHDPSVAYWDGYYYMYGTDASYGNEHTKATTGRHFQGKRSRDLVNWTYLPGPMNDAPAWVEDSLNAIRGRMGLPAIAKSDIQYGYWAPVVRRVEVGGKQILRMYYCIVIDNYIKTGKPSSAAFDGSWGERAFIGMCESTDPANAKWEDKGFVTCSSTDKGRDGWSRPNQNDWKGYFYYNAIDPTYIVAPDGKHWLIHGSWHSGFALLEINPETGKPINNLGEPWADNVADLTARYGKRIGTRRNNDRWQASEAPEIVYNNGYYYLFMAYDALDVPYNTRVVRSANIEGPYVDINGTNFTQGGGDCYPIVTHPYKFKTGDGWVGISHCCVFKEEKGNRWFYMSQGRLPAGAGGNAWANAIMMGHVRQLVWCPASADTPDDLWPIALPERYAGVPDMGAITESEIVGIWEHIDLRYEYGKQQQAGVNLEIKANGTFTGPISGKWTYDKAKQWLTLDFDKGKVVLCLAREVDWEASPRKVTIVYAGTAKNLNSTFWGKKVD